MELASLQGSMAWDLIFLGASIAVVIEFLGLNSLVVAVGVYLPVHVSTPIIIGGAVRWLIDFFTKDEGLRRLRNDSGVLFASGLIAGESLIGVVIAILIVAGVPIPESPVSENGWISCAVFLAVTFLLWYIARRASSEKAERHN